MLEVFVLLDVLGPLCSSLSEPGLSKIRNPILPKSPNPKLQTADAARQSRSPGSAPCWTSRSFVSTRASRERALNLGKRQATRMQ